jgi:diadenosine tetraphosphate (Ap4A) HIT family hydrolase
MPDNCPFCNPDRKKILISTTLCYAIFDRYPVAPGHILIIPFRHFPDYFESTPLEVESFDALLRQCRTRLEEEYHPDGYNVGVNVGNAAGQTVPHMHIHLIPRYRGDTRHPRGGVRGVIPEKQDY